MGLPQHLGRNARDSHTAGLVIGAGATVFNFLWLLAPPVVDGASRDLPVGGLGFLLIASLNAYLATRLVWGRLVPAEGAFSVGRGAAVGIVLGFFAMFTFSAIGLPLLAGLDTFLSFGEPASAGTAGAAAGFDPLSWVFLALFGTVYGMVVTGWIPLAITVAGAVGLAHLENQHVA